MVSGVYSPPPQPAGRVGTEDSTVDPRSPTDPRPRVPVLKGTEDGRFTVEGVEIGSPVPAPLCVPSGYTCRFWLSP